MNLGLGFVWAFLFFTPGLIHALLTKRGETAFRRPAFSSQSVVFISQVGFWSLFHHLLVVIVISANALVVRFVDPLPLPDGNYFLSMSKWNDAHAWRNFEFFFMAAMYMTFNVILAFVLARSESVSALISKLASTQKNSEESWSETLDRQSGESAQKYINALVVLKPGPNNPYGVVGPVAEVLRREDEQILSITLRQAEEIRRTARGALEVNANEPLRDNLTVMATEIHYLSLSLEDPQMVKVTPQAYEQMFREFIEATVELGAEEIAYNALRALFETQALQD